MVRYRLEYAACNDAQDVLIALDVPDICTALVVAEINAPAGGAHIYDGNRRIARLERQHSARGGYWSVS